MGEFLRFLPAHFEVSHRFAAAAGSSAAGPTKNLRKTAAAYGPHVPTQRNERVKNSLAGDGVLPAKNAPQICSLGAWVLVRNHVGSRSE